MNKKNKKVIIIGAGLVGSLWALYLSRRGYQVSVYEKRPDLRNTDISSGRSINLALSDRGWKALAGAGMEEKIRKVSIPMYGRRIHHENDSIDFQAYGMENQAIWSVSRGGLNAALMDAAETAGASIFFNHKCVGLDADKRRVFFANGFEKSADLIFGADGAFSNVRHCMIEQGALQENLVYLDHGYKELSIPADTGNQWRLDKNALHIWPRRSFMLIALANLDGSFTSTLFAPNEGDNSLASLDAGMDVEAFFKENFFDAFKLMPSLIEDFKQNPSSRLATVYCQPWTWKHRFCLIGDAAHGIVPFYGQGMNAGFEDCTLLAEMMDKYEENWPLIFENYDKTRKINADAIARLAVQNFVEMRDRVADHSFLMRKKIENGLQRLFPDEYMPLYSLVTFSQRPYAEALAIGRKEEQFFKQLVENQKLPDDLSDFDLTNILQQWRQFKSKSGNN